MHPWVARRWYDLTYSTTWAFLSVFASLRTNGRANMPKDGPALLLANHASFLDPPMVGISAPRYISYMARKSLFAKKYLGGLITSLDAIPIEYKGFSREGLMATIERLERGKAVIMFPEGERSHDGKMSEFKPGLLLLLKRVKCPIIPVGIAGTYHTWNRHMKRPSLCPVFMPPDERCLAVSIGKPIPPAVYGEWSRDELMGKLFEAVKAQEGEAKKLQRKRRD